MAHKFTGSITALVTPFKDGAVDEQSFVAMVERQIAAGTHGLVPMGTTGEAPTLTLEEHRRVVALCVETARGRVPVIAGAGSNDTAKALELVKIAEDVGADGLLCATGYYNKPNQQGFLAHFSAISDATNLPVIVYNVPGRTGADISVGTIAELSKRDNIIALKDATGDLARVALQRLASGKDFTLLSGEDMTAVGFNAMGGTGCISVTANIVPQLCADMQNACLLCNWDEALDLQDRLAPLHDALFCETSPGPAKYALWRLGLCAPDTRLPLTPISDQSKALIDGVLDGLGLL